MEVSKKMYSNNIKFKIDKMFNDLSEEIKQIVDESCTLNDAVNQVSHCVSSEIESRSKTMLSDMLFYLNNSVLDDVFFADNIARQNDFLSRNFPQEILSKYQFSITAKVDYQEASQALEAAKIGAGGLAIGGACAIGSVLIGGLSLSSFVPIPIGILFTAAFGAAMGDYFFIEPNRNKKQFFLAIDKYLSEAKKQYINWFNEIENYFYKYVDDFKQVILGDNI
jgi:hypothetical protein